MNEKSPPLPPNVGVTQYTYCWCHSAHIENIRIIFHTEAMLVSICTQKMLVLPWTHNWCTLHTQTLFVSRCTHNVSVILGTLTALFTRVRGSAWHLRLYLFQLTPQIHWSPIPPPLVDVIHERSHNQHRFNSVLTCSWFDVENCFQHDQACLTTSIWME